MVLRDNTSISPADSAVKRSAAVNGTYLTALASPRTAAAIASHVDASIPTILPALFGAAKPATPPSTPQTNSPRA